MTLATFGLVSLIGLGLAGSAQAADPAAAPETKGTVTFDVDWSIQPPIQTDNIENPNPSSEDGDKDLSVIYAMDFDFGRHNYNGQELPALPVKLGSYKIPAVPADPETETPGVEEKKISDVLGISIGNSGNTPRWNLYVRASEFKNSKDETKIVKGLRMTLHDITARQVVGTIAPTIPSPTSLEIDGTNKPVASYENNSADPEMTITNFAFGKYPIKKDSDGNPILDGNGKEIPDDTATTYNGVTLKVPNGRAIENDETYTSDITWTLAVDSI